MTPDRRCIVHIFLPGETEPVAAGTFVVTARGQGFRGEFAYEREYLQREDAVALDPVELHLSTQVHETARMQGFFGAIRDAMPDDWGRRVLERRKGLPRLEEFDYLMEGPDDRAGALRFESPSGPSALPHRFGSPGSLERLQEVADAVARDEPVPVASDEEQFLSLLQAGTSMGGARPKVTIEHDDALWLAKFGFRDDVYASPRVEHALMNLARACGLDAAETRVESAGDREVLLVRRFDREKFGDSYFRHRMVSAMTVLQAEGALTDRDRWSYLLLADEIRRSCVRPEHDLAELFSRMCFNAATSNLDDHPRNHALLATARDWNLSPAYDLTASPAISTDRRSLAMICGLRGRDANKGNLLSAAPRFFLGADEAEKIFGRIAETVRSGWDEEMRRAGVAEETMVKIRGSLLHPGLFYDHLE